MTLNLAGLTSHETRKNGIQRQKKGKNKMITLKQAKNLNYGDILHHTINKNADGTPQRWRVNGKVKTWKRSSSKVKIPLKYGLYRYDYLTENDLNLVDMA